MYKKTLVALGAAGFVVGAAMTKKALNNRSYKKSIAEIDSRTETEIAVLIEAAGVIQRRLLTGYYDNKSYPDLESDFDFEVIRLHNQ